MIAALLLLAGCGTPRVETTRAMPTPADLQHHCDQVIGEPRVLELGDRIRVAIGYDLANTIAIRTGDGWVVVDVGMSPERAAPVRDALLPAGDRVAAIVYTHSHIDHVGGASVWVDEGTEIWATDAFTPRFFSQYGAFFRAESARAGRQFGAHVSEEALGCAALGRRPDLVAALVSGVVLPTHTFSGRTQLEVGGVGLELVEAHGETVDQLYVWLPSEQALLPGDNWYHAFPNLYTLRGTTARPVDTWIESLDRMRAEDPALLIPSHTTPVQGREAVRLALRDYRDGIQWVRDAVVRGALDGIAIDQLAAEVGLPEHLADVDALRELYGQVDWSVRAIYDTHLGWFDGRPEVLYPLPPSELATRTVDAMGGPDAVLTAAREAREAGDLRWAMHLQRLLVDDGREPDGLTPERTTALRALAGEVSNTNGRAWLLEAAHELTEGTRSLGQPQLSDAFIDSLPLSVLFSVMPSRLKPGTAMDVHDSVVFAFDDTDERYVVTVRRGVAEVVQGEPIPGTPAALATVHTNARTWRRVALRTQTAVGALTAGDMRVEGPLLGFKAFMDRFEQGFGGSPSPLP